ATWKKPRNASSGRSPTGCVSASRGRWSMFRNWSRVNGKLLLWLWDRKREVEGRPGARGGLHPHPAALPRDCLPAVRQSQTAARKIFSVQPLKDAEYSFLKYELDTRAIVSHRNYPFPLAALRRNVNVRIGSAGVLDGIANQMVKHLG